AHGLVNQSQYAEALAVLDEAAEAVRLEPPYMLGLRVEALRGLGRRSEAIALADQALADYPEEGAFYLLLGQLYLDAGDAEAAVPMLERSTALSQHHYQSFFLLAQAYVSVGRTAEAERTNARAEQIRKDYDTVTALGREAIDHPWDPAVRIRLAEYCERTGDA